MRLAIEEPIMFSVLQALIDMGLWKAWAEAGGGEKDIGDLAKMTARGDPDLLRHQLRLMATNHIVQETGNDRYAPTTFSLALGDSATLIAAGLRIRTDHIAQCAMHWPDFLSKTNYLKPLDDKNSCYVDSFPEKKTFFERCSANHIHQESFSSFMNLWAKQKRPWPEIYDTDALLERADLKNGSPFVVDIGGHHGIDLLRVLEKHPDLPTGYKGARAYFMHAVLHDWSDESAVQILKRTAAAMKPGYSKVLINDIVIPDTGASCYQAAMDCLVLQASANERTETVWKKVISEAGLKLVKIYPDGRGYESVVEAELP